MSRHALLVAVGDYEDPRLNALRAPQQDVTRLAAVLEDPEVGGFDSVRVVVDAPDHEIRRALEDTLAERGADDLVLVYFSCHGIKTPQQRLYFAATNTRQDRPAGTAVARTFVNELFEDCRAASRVLLLDCCFSGAYGKGIKASVGGSVLDDRGGEGYLVLTASNAFEYAFEEERLSLEAPQASVFTDVLLQGLSSGAADLDGDGWIDVQELFNYVHREVTARRRDQTPKFFAHGADAAIRIARAGGSRLVPAQAVKPLYTPQQMLVARGFRAAAEPICRTLGPLGRRSVVLREDGRYVELAEAATIAEAFRVSDPRDELGASYVREVVRQVHQHVGDGAATAVVIAQALVENLLEALRAGAHPIRLMRDLDAAYEAVWQHLADSRRVLGTADEVVELATSSSDQEIGELIGRAVSQVGWDGTLIVEESNRLGLGVELTGGFRFAGGYLSGYFLTDSTRQVAELEDAYVLVCFDEISTVAPLVPVLEKVMKEGRPLLVVAHDVTGEALATLVVNKVRETFKSVAVRGPSTAPEMDRLASVLEARVLSADILHRAELAWLGRARKVVVSEHETVVVVDGDSEDSRVAVLTVGALSESALAERRRRIERAVLTVRLAVAEGVVEGGGVALARAADALDGTVPAHAALADALRQPQRRLALNAGLDSPEEPETPVLDSARVQTAVVDVAVRTAKRFLLLG
ncbi:caspase, EACC1-associated type [Lentzea sp. E54]|uniref:caspase, EACC1-associated type n=1 Tax=Lentzea xerophila TaxID=3435883 RepID=UPI003DA309E0